MTRRKGEEHYASKKSGGIRRCFVNFVEFLKSKSVERIAPPHVIGEPIDGSVEPGVRFVVGAAGNAGGAGSVHAGPVHATGLGIDGPLDSPFEVGDRGGFGGSLAAHDALRRTLLGADFAFAAKLDHSEIDR